MKKSELRQLIKEEIQKLNELQTLVGQTSGVNIIGLPLFNPPRKFHIVCHYSGGGIVYTNGTCPDTPAGAAPGDAYIPPSSDFKRPDRKVKSIT
jgi:hypothetical protein